MTRVTTNDGVATSRLETKASEMNIVELTNGAEVACNREFEGLFSRKPDGTWQQHAGTGDTPRFRSPRHLITWARTHFDDDAWSSRRLSGGWR